MCSTRTKLSCRVVPSGPTFHGKQGLDYFSGISAESVGATGICMHMVTIPPGTRANAHLHQNHETAIYVLSGEAEMWFGDDLSEYLTMKAGDYVYIPAPLEYPIYPVTQVLTFPASGSLLVRIRMSRRASSCGQCSTLQSRTGVELDAGGQGLFHGFHA
jgi:uncharacterized RmlC-like cupin family protein